MNHQALVDDWRELGRFVDAAGEQVFVIDQLAEQDDHHPPLLVLHGYPTSSIDFADVLPALHAHRRVVLMDLPGFGFADKPDRAYSLFGQADAVEAVVAGLGLTEIDLLTHDISDSVGGELLARSIDGTLGFSVRRRVITNGSIYMDLVQLSDGQKYLESLGDVYLDADAAPSFELLEAALRGTFGAPPASDPKPAHVAAATELVLHNQGNRLLARLIRYIDERRHHESRWYEAIERHQSRLGIVWGDADPIAVYAMAERLAERRPDATLVRLEGVGHYPMLEAPVAFGDAVCAGLDD